MKNLFLFLLISSAILSFSSCRKCTSCKLTQQQKGAPTSKVGTYDKCGNKTEVKDFKTSMDQVVADSYNAGTGDTAFVACVDK